MKERQVVESFSRLPGSDQIASLFAAEGLAFWLRRQRPQSVLEIGAGIGCLSEVIRQWLIEDFPVFLDAKVVCVEDNPWCREQWRNNLEALPPSMRLVERIPNQFFQFLVLDGPQLRPEDWAILLPNATVFVEGNRREQRARLRQYLRNVGRPFCETPHRPPDRSKGIWLIRCEPTWWERVAFRVNRIAQWLWDLSARFRGRPIGKRLVSGVIAAFLLGGCGVERLQVTVTDVRLATHVSVVTTGDSGTTGAVVGGLLFGPVGAVVGYAATQELPNQREIRRVTCWVFFEASDGRRFEILVYYNETLCLVRSGDRETLIKSFGAGWRWRDELVELR